MKRNLYMGGMTLVALLAMGACTDFSDYNEASVDANPTGNKTLWENICADADLSNFKSLVEKAGFSDALNSSHYYTVWAPTNSSFSVADYENVEASTLLTQFVKNHIADYNYPLSADSTVRVRTLNEKSYNLVGGTAPTYDGITVTTANIGSNNGTLHKIGGVAAYYPSAYDYILSSTDGIDSMKTYFASHETSYLDEANSVVGPIVDGKQTYVDSVIVTNNVISNLMRASLTNEDSSYTVLLPTDKAWNAEYAKVKGYYNILAKTPLKTYDSQGQETTETEITRDNAYLTDSLTKRAIARNLFYSNTNGYNKWLLTSAADKQADTICTTSRDRIGNPLTLLSHEQKRVSFSNGQGIVVDTIDMHTWDSYSPEYEFDALYNLAAVTGGTTSRKSFSVVETKQSFTYLNVDYTSTPTMKFYLPSILSETYQVYIAFGPGYDVLKEEVDTLPNHFYVSITCCQKGGSNLEQFFVPGDSLQLTKTTSRATSIFENQAGLIWNNGQLETDTVYVGQFTFPVSYAGVSESGRGPVLTIKDATNILNKKDRESYSRRYRIMSIILKPVELDTYEKSQSK